MVLSQFHAISKLKWSEKRVGHDRHRTLAKQTCLVAPDDSERYLTLASRSKSGEHCVGVAIARPDGLQMNLRNRSATHGPKILSSIFRPRQQLSSAQHQAHSIRTLRRE